MNDAFSFSAELDHGENNHPGLSSTWGSGGDMSESA